MKDLAFMSTNPKISILVSARKNSKYLAKFLYGYLNNSAYPLEHEVLVMLNAHDTWNADMVEWIIAKQLYAPVNKRPFKFYREDLQLGRAGLHQYFNKLAKEGTGDWLIYFCEDHYINPPEKDPHNRAFAARWDQYFLTRIDALKLNPNDIYCLVPKFDNCGAMNHMLSRGYYKALGGVMGHHGWIDSYINDINRIAFGDHSEHVIKFDRETFHDFTHDKPNPMSDAHMQSVVSEAGKNLPKYGGGHYEGLIQEDAAKLRLALERGSSSNG